MSVSEKLHYSKVVQEHTGGKDFSAMAHLWVPSVFAGVASENPFPPDVDWDKAAPIDLAHKKVITKCRLCCREISQGVLTMLGMECMLGISEYGRAFKFGYSRACWECAPLNPELARLLPRMAGSEHKIIDKYVSRRYIKLMREQPELIPADIKHMVENADAVLRTIVKHVFEDEERKILRKVTTQQPVCNSCFCTEGSKQCGQCRLILYCNRECQKKDWPKHKAACGFIAAKTSFVMLEHAVSMPTYEFFI